MPFGYDADFDVTTLGTLTAAGVSDGQKTTGKFLTFQVVVASIGTNVVFRFEGSLDGVSYFNLDADGSDTTVTANGTTGYFLIAPVAYVRFRVVSTSGGTPSATCKIGCA